MAIANMGSSGRNIQGKRNMEIKKLPILVQLRSFMICFVRITRRSEGTPDNLRTSLTFFAEIKNDKLNKIMYAAFTGTLRIRR